MAPLLGSRRAEQQCGSDSHLQVRRLLRRSFAIAITLLVLELEVPQGGDDLLGELGHEWPSFPYLVSFAFIGSVWIAHSTLGSSCAQPISCSWA